VSDGWIDLMDRLMDGWMDIVLHGWMDRYKCLASDYHPSDGD